VPFGTRAASTDAVVPNPWAAPCRKVSARQVVIDNRPGARRQHRHRARLQKSLPDGLQRSVSATLAYVANPFVLAKTAVQQPKRILRRSALLRLVPLVLTVHPSLAGADGEGIYSPLAKSRPGGLNYAFCGQTQAPTFAGGGSNLNTWRASTSRTSPYKSAGAAVVSLVGRENRDYGRDPCRP